MTVSTEPLAQAIRFAAADGAPLAGMLYEPPRPPGPLKTSVLLAGGLGIAQRFYAPFAGYLAQRGHCVLSFDLRGMGASRLPEHRRSLRGLQADMLTWARQDFAAAVEWLASRAPDGRIALGGHSLGTHHAAMTTPDTQARIAVAVSVAAGSGYWRDWTSASRRKAPLMLHLAAPAMRQWNRWCGHPGFAWGAQPALVLPSSQTARFRNNAYQKRTGCPHHISQSKKENHAPTYLHQAWSI